ncbi:OmpA family protein [Elizabethkingia anophelis]|uniref:OmpA family protein n=2 Tax=Elizabethkingia anophelis TaxID=1117645 RepID=UPI0016274E4E|nr:OmpA family protein [Elizabethkingia anophelis]
MKNLKLGITALALTVATTAFAQTTSNPWLIGVGAHGENHKAQANNFSNTFGAQNLTKRLFNLNNFSITPPLSKLTVARNINKYLVADLQASVGNVGNKKFNMDKEFFLMAGLGLQFKFNGLWNEESWFDPYARVGANYLRHDYSGLTFPRTDAMNVNYYPTYNGNGDVTGKKNFFALSTGLGSNFWITKNFGLGIQGDYVTTPGDKSTVANFWQASASLLFRFGNRDRDKDGIPDKDDRCPDTPGLPEFQGCPDTDGDGIPDIDDKCPDVAGPKENQGCPWPDRDNDGVLDKDDRCPDTPGLAQFQGCPDTDGDGIPDIDDKCPTQAGPKENQGCPWPTDVQVTKELKDILFDFNKATIQSGSLSKVDAAAAIIKGAKAENFLVTGYTDAKGNANYNLKLSQQRASSVVKALEARGVNGSQLKSVGVGAKEATVPATASDAERQKDRKVEVRAISNDTEWAAYKKDDVTVVKPVKKGVKKSSKKVIKKKK